MEEERQKIVLGALFHDIGKVVQRADENPAKKTHQEFGKDWLEKHLSSKRYLADFSLYHHTKTRRPELDVCSTGRNDLFLVAKADNLSSEEREEEASKLFTQKASLKSVFSSINLENTPKPSPKYYPAVSLCEGIVYVKEKLELEKKDYKRLLEDFEKTLKGTEITPDLSLALLEQFFSFVPAYTAKIHKGSEEEFTDISLFDHLKTTAAIAVSCYNYLVENYNNISFSEIPHSKIKDESEQKYMLIGVDISGIQDFIYTISSKGALKLLRARSFYIEILLEFVAMNILEKLNLFRTNLLFIGGGNFLILSQATEKAKATVKEIINDINEWLWDEHQGRLWLVCGFVEFEGDTFVGEGKEFKTISHAIERLHEVLAKEKLHKFSSIPKKKLFSAQDIDGRYECEVCYSDISKKDWEKDRKCSFCRMMQDVGRVIHKAKYLAYKPEKKKNSLGAINICDKEIAIFPKEIPPSGKWVWVINPDPQEICKVKGIPLYMGDYPKVSRNFDTDVPEKEKKEAPVFNYFGSTLIGTLRMDVDDLGRIFSEGLPFKRRTISRISTLSRLLNLFFKRYINEIAKGEVGELSQFSVVHPERNFPREVVVVYAGGDDLFIVGAWHDVIEVAFDIRKAFRRFVGGDHITISAGISLNHIKHPIHIFAKDAEKAEKSSKALKGKDGLTVFSTTLKWKKWDELKEKFLLVVRRKFYEDVEIKVENDFIVSALPSFLRSKKDGIPRTLIYNLIKISEALKDRFSLTPYASLAYLLGKNSRLKNEDCFKQLANIKNIEFLRNLKPILIWLDLLQRGGFRYE